MKRTFVGWVIAFSAFIGFGPSGPIPKAQANEISVPSGSMEWQYECPAGTSCPTVCKIGANEIFSTANYASVTILQLPKQVFWFRIDTGAKMAEFVLRAEQVNCSISGATLKAARAWEPGSSEPRKQQ
jgi:hypothetical protein